MTFSSLKGTAIVLSMLFSLTVYADAQQQSSDFQTICTDAWMKKADKAKDKVDYKNFGEKYCSCAAKQPLENDDAVKKAIQLCMSRTLLHDAMDSLEDEITLSKAKESDINDYCLDRWSVVLPQQTEDDKKLINAYCQCAQPKLMDLIRQSDTMTDNEYEAGIDKVADHCVENSLVTKPTPTQ
ncbi:hypothetical protein [Legionella cincinnatiensis]|uniref:Secreted protein n=1 Tax=Legionella cincinnatiensis TaxID=28085 RepID=A0A378IG02_9GAMM|nr:hypothetical protein [Legionella cincinnatiensis]KTC82726.1 hypothetical protein Lcin_2755 [Legionella cincinnatiensis]STX34157.1 Uncharacterised protein [Legionella cincinnatiensis]